MPPLEELVLQLPHSIKGVGAAWLSVADGPSGKVWTAGYENMRGRRVEGRFYEGDTAREALQRLADHNKDRYLAFDILSRPVGGKE